MAEQLNFWSEERLARLFPLPDSEKDLRTREAIYRSPSAKLQITSTQSGFSGKTSRASSRRKTTPLDAFWQDFAERVNPSFQTEDGQVRAWYLDRNAQLPGAFAMLNTLEWPNEGAVSLCSLSQVLQTGKLPLRYFLSEKACSGILLRADRRGKELPATLKAALANTAPTTARELARQAEEFLGGGSETFVTAPVFFEPRSPDGVPRIYPVDGASPTLNTMGGGQREPCVTHEMAVRRLTPIECERLQGFPDNFTQIPWRNKPAEECPDGPRYKALGNSMAVPNMRWIAERIERVKLLTSAN